MKKLIFIPFLLSVMSFNEPSNLESRVPEGKSEEQVFHKWDRQEQEAPQTKAKGKEVYKDQYQPGFEKQEVQCQCPQVKH